VLNSAQRRRVDGDEPPPQLIEIHRRILRQDLTPAPAGA
jgi:hypothetical protein